GTQTDRAQLGDDEGAQVRIAQRQQLLRITDATLDILITHQRQPMQQFRMPQQHQIVLLRKPLEQQPQPAQDVDIKQVRIVDQNVQRLVRLYVTSRRAHQFFFQ